MKINVSMELSKNEIVESINSICNKYNLPACLLQIILNNIMQEVNNMTQEELKKDMSDYLNSQNSQKESDK